MAQLVLLKKFPVWYTEEISLMSDRLWLREKHLNKLRATASTLLCSASSGPPALARAADQRRWWLGQAPQPPTAGEEDGRAGRRSRVSVGGPGLDPVGFWLGSFAHPWLRAAMS